MAISIKKLAKQCNLGRSTVANILGGRADLYASDTREKVLSAARDYGYVPSRLPAALRNRETKTVGVLVPDIYEPYFMELLTGITRRLTAIGIESMVRVNPWQTKEEAWQVYDDCLGWHPQALLVLTSMQLIDPRDVEKLLDHTVLLSVNAQVWPQCPAVQPNRRKNFQLAVDHLVELGHRRIGAVSYGKDQKIDMLSQALHSHGLKLRPDDLWLCVQPGMHRMPSDTHSDAFDLGQQLAKTDDRPTAVIAMPDAIAARFISGFIYAGGAVPQDLSVVAYNNTWFAERNVLPMTVVGVPMDTYCDAVITTMQEGIAAHRKGQRYSVDVQLEPELVVRKSTAALKETIGIR